MAQIPMMRILHSLPRTHKLLLLPVATMVTVLGTQKIITSYQDVQREHQTLDTVIVPIDASKQHALPSLNFENGAVADAIKMATQAIDATREHVPLARLAPSEIVDLDVDLTIIDSASAHRLPAAEVSPSLASLDEPAIQPLAAAPEQPNDAIPLPADTPSPLFDEGALHIAIVIGTIGSGMLDHDGSLVADATSYDATSYYEDIPENELTLFEEGPIILEQEIASRDSFVPEWKTYRVKQGDTFAVMAQQHLGLGYRQVMGLLDQLPDKNILARWRAGDHFEYQLDAEGALLAMRIMKNVRDGFLVKRQDEGYDVATIERAGEATQRLFAGTVNGSFTRSAQATGLSSTEVSQLSRLLEKKLDFRRDTRRGDRFQVLVESDIIDGQNFDPRIIAVEYDGERMDLTLVRHSGDSNFYTPEGESLDPAFNRYPFEGRYRLSSNFNPNRKHPVTGRISPHRGTDFAMPIGTAVQTPADGNVEKVGNHPLAGRYLVIRHDNGYRTRYLHLSKPLVSRGERVKMGERIALSGNTGRSTGPHLHYEVMVDNKQVDAMRVELPENKSLSGEMLMAFKQEAKPVLAALQSGETGTVVARVPRPESVDDEG
jgi:murein DD-endopeptidase